MRKILYTLLIVGVLGILVAYKLYNKPHRHANEKPFVSMHAHELFNLFSTNEQQANENFLDKVLQVNGTVTEVRINQEGKQILVLESDDPIFGISCTLTQQDEKIKKGDVIHIKGICKGYLSDVVLTDCIIINP